MSSASLVTLIEGNFGLGSLRTRVTSDSGHFRLNSLSGLFSVRIHKLDPNHIILRGALDRKTHIGRVNSVLKGGMK